MANQCYFLALVISHGMNGCWACPSTHKGVIFFKWQTIKTRVRRVAITTNTVMTSSNGNISTLLALCAGTSPVTGEFSAQRLVTQDFDDFFVLRLNKRLSKQWWGWWFDTPSRLLWRHCNDKTDKVLIRIGMHTSKRIRTICPFPHNIYIN